MSDEIQYAVSATIKDSSGVQMDSWTSETVKVTQTTPNSGGHPGTVAVTTAEADMTTTGLTTPSMLYLKNLDGTNYVTYGPKSGGAMILFGKLKPKDVHILRLGASVILRWLANSATCRVLAKCYDD